MTEAVTGVILAGGLARRMGGGDKPLKTIGGKTILAHVIERFEPQCGHLFLNANGDPARFSEYGLAVIADSVPDFAGPLAGILAGLDHAATLAPAPQWIVSVAADTPFLPRDLIARLVAAQASESADVACAASGGRKHPVIGLWPLSVRQDLRRALTDEGERKIDRFTARYRLAVAEWETEAIDPFFNANDPMDLRRAEETLSHMA